MKKLKNIILTVTALLMVIFACHQQLLWLAQGIVNTASILWFIAEILTAYFIILPKKFRL